MMPTRSPTWLPMSKTSIAGLDETGVERVHGRVARWLAVVDVERAPKRGEARIARARQCAAALRHAGSQPRSARTAVISAGVEKSSGMPHSPSDATSGPTAAIGGDHGERYRRADSRRSAAGSTRTPPARPAAARRTRRRRTASAATGSRAAVAPRDAVGVARLAAPGDRLAERQADHEDRWCGWSIRRPAGTRRRARWRRPRGSASAPP